MRILFVAHGYPPEAQGGTELHTRTLARELATAGHEVFVFAANRHAQPVEGGVRDRRDGDVRVRLIDVRVEADFAMKLEDPDVRATFERYLDEVGPDVVHVQHLLYLSADLVEVAKGRGLPVVVSLHDSWFQCPRIHLTPGDSHPFRGDWWGAACFRHYEQPSLRRTVGLARERRLGEAVARYRRRATFMRTQLGLADRVIVPSGFLGERFRAFGVAGEKVTVLPHVVHVGGGGERGIDAPVEFGFMGAIAPEKGVHVLCEAFARVPGQSTLKLFGRSEHPDYLAALAPRFDSRIRYEGEFEHARIDAVFAQFDVLVVPSLVLESFSLVALEAQAFGRPVIASRVGALQELVQHGRNGLLVAPGNASALRDALARLCDVEEARRLQAGVRRPPSPVTYARAVEAMYETLAEPRAPARARVA